MILIGQYDSPFVRRVGIALTLYGIAFTQEPWSSFADADRIRPYNPLTRVPTLVLDDDVALSDSHLILDYLDSLVPAERAMFPRGEPMRHEALRIAGLATGVGDKAVSLFYEKTLHRETSAFWVERCRKQIFGALALLDADRAKRAGEYWFGDRIGHADIAVAVMLRFIAEVHAGLVAMADYPALEAHAARCETLPAFRAIYQEFIPPT